VAQNLEAQGNLYGLAGAVLAGRTERLLRPLQLTGREHEPAEQLSGGLARRVEIAKALLQRTGRCCCSMSRRTGLDPAARREWLDLLTALRRERELTVLMTTHLLDEAERCDRLTLLHEGRVAAGGTPGGVEGRGRGRCRGVRHGRPGAGGGAVCRGEPGGGRGSGAFVTPGGARFAAHGADVLPGVIESIAVQRPTLQGCLFRHTGARL
jgi:ABC-2 type transport system ATP-binding protein